MKVWAVEALLSCRTARHKEAKQILTVSCHGSKQVQISQASKIQEKVAVPKHFVQHTVRDE